jgi:hypothetical protein
MKKYSIFLAILNASMATVFGMDNAAGPLTEILQAPSYEESTKKAYELSINSGPQEKTGIVLALSMKYKENPMQIEHDILNRTYANC